MNSTACRYYTERSIGWMLNNKIIVFLSLLSFCLFVSTLAMAGQRNRLATRVVNLEAALANASNNAPELQNTEAPVTAAPATEAPETAAPATEAPETAAPTTEVPTTEAPTTVAPTTEAPTTSDTASVTEQVADPTTIGGKAFDVDDGIVSEYKNSRLLRRLGFVA
ncbi:hypothetical protein O3G_MSEX004245 [Manduca sexta]|uniref:Uncharacterized protein n=1 Tax=Manduca sexta TaxID=7130 RepID=A0A921YVL3_MANSE|nr:hypothetical protein O3G_MSEX004245 [Manduca sexta]